MLQSGQIGRAQRGTVLPEMLFTHTYVFHIWSPRLQEVFASDFRLALAKKVTISLVCNAFFSTRESSESVAPLPRDYEHLL